MASNATIPYVFPSNVATIVCGVLAIITNATLLIITFLDPLKSFKRSSIYFIISLSFSDFFTGITSCFYALSNCVSLPKILVLGLTCSIWASAQNSFITILLMSIERLIVVRNPLKAKSVITKRRTIISIGVTWFISIAVGAAVGIPEPYKTYVMFSFVIECCVMVIIMLLIYLRILCLLRNSTKLFRGNSFRRSQSDSEGRSVESSKRQHNLNLVVFYLAVFLIVTVLPHLISGQIYLGYKLFFSERNPPQTLDIVPYITFPLELLNFIVNPVIYAWRLPEYRKALCYYFRRRKGVQRRGSGSFTSRQTLHVRVGKKRCREDSV